MDTVLKNSSRFDGDQPSHYEYEPFDAEKALKLSPSSSNKSAGEFEMPVMDNYQLHSKNPKQNQALEQSKEVKSSTELYMEKIVHWANGLNILSSGISAVGSAVSKNEKVKNFLEKFVSFGAKTSMGINSAFNIFNGHKLKDLSHVIGYSGELLASILAPYNVLGLIRGATFSTYQASNILASVKPMEESKSYSHYVSQVKDRLPILAKKLFSLDTYKNLQDNLGTITGGWGGLFSLTGVLGWAVTGSTKFGGWVKGIGEVLVDSYQVVPENWKNKKQFYISSGMAFIMGSMCEIISKQRDNDPVTMALYFFGSGLGRLLYTISNIRGENTYGPGGVKPGEASDANQSISEGLMGAFGLSGILNSNKAKPALA